MDHRRPSVGAGAGGGAGFEITQKGALLLGGKYLSRFDRRAFANTGDDPGFDLCLQRGFVFFKVLYQHAEGGARIEAGEDDGEAPDEKSVAPEFFDLKSQLAEERELAFKQASLGGGQFDRGGFEETLGGDVGAAWGVALRASKGHKFFKQDPFVGSVLIDQVQAVGAFGDEVRGGNLPYQTEEGDAFGREFRLGRDGRGRRWFESGPPPGG